MSEESEYKSGYDEGFADAANGRPQSVPSDGNMSAGGHILTNIFLPVIGTLLSAGAAMSSVEKNGPRDRGYIAGYTAGLQKLRNDAEYTRLNS